MADRQQSPSAGPRTKLNTFVGTLARNLSRDDVAFDDDDRTVVEVTGKRYCPVSLFS